MLVLVLVLVLQRRLRWELLLLNRLVMNDSSTMPSLALGLGVTKIKCCMWCSVGKVCVLDVSGQRWIISYLNT
jgi:hypothetical protein